MKRWTRNCLLLLTASLMAFSAAISAQAASDEKINKVSLRFEGTAPKSGESIDSISVSVNGEGYSVDDAEYTNLDDADTWAVGDLPEVLVTLSAEDGYRFSYTTKSHFSLSGMNAEFEKAKIMDSGSYMELTVSLKRVSGKLTGTESLEWDDSFGASWDPIEGAKSYEVALYRDEKKVNTVTTSNTSFDFSDYITKEGDYTFRVRAVSDYNDRAGEWSEYSDSQYADEDAVRTSVTSGGWRQDQNGWWYAYQGGGYPVSCWKQIGGAWYHFNGSGYMETGWQKISNEWYYMNSSGAMLTGWQLINGAWYYLNGSGVMTTGWQLVNGTWYYMNGSGVMLTGWQLINGTWYYFDSSGAMWAGRQTPDGYYVDGSGAYRG